MLQCNAGDCFRVIVQQPKRWRISLVGSASAEDAALRVNWISGYSKMALLLMQHLLPVGVIDS